MRLSKFIKLQVVYNILGMMGVVGPMIALLKDEDEDVRSDAADLLGEVGNSRAVVPLIAALEDDGLFVRQSAANSLGLIPDARAVEPLIKVLEQSKSSKQSKINSAWALGKIGDVRAVEPLIAVLKQNDDWLSSQAAYALGEIGDVRAIEPLVAVLRDLGSACVLARESANALGEIGDVQAEETLMAALESKNAYVRMEAAHALRKIGSTRALAAEIDTLIASLNDRDKKVRADVVGYLVKYEDVRVMDALADALNDPDDKVREKSEWALGEIRYTRAIGLLVEVLETCVDWEIRENVAKALVKIGDARAVEPLIKVLERASCSKQSKLLTAWVLGRIGDDRTIEPLRELARNDSEKDVQKAARRALARIRRKGRTRKGSLRSRI